METSSIKTSASDMIVTYFLAVLIYSVGGLISLVFGLIVALPLLLIPTGFYFYRNPCNTKEALFRSIFFGFTFFFVLILFLGLPLFFGLGLMSGLPGISFLFIPGIPGIVLAFLIFGTFASVVNFISYFAVELILKRAHA